MAIGIKRKPNTEKAAKATRPTRPVRGTRPAPEPAQTQRPRRPIRNTQPVLDIDDLDELTTEPVTEEPAQEEYAEAPSDLENFEGYEESAKAPAEEYADAEDLNDYTELDEYEDLSDKIQQEAFTEPENFEDSGNFSDDIDCEDYTEPEMEEVQEEPAAPEPQQTQRPQRPQRGMQQRVVKKTPEGSEVVAASPANNKPNNANSKVQIRKRRVRDEEPVKETKEDEAMFSFKGNSRELYMDSIMSVDASDYTFDEFGNLIKGADLNSNNTPMQFGPKSENEEDINKQFEALFSGASTKIDIPEAPAPVQPKVEEKEESLLDELMNSVGETEAEVPAEEPVEEPAAEAEVPVEEPVSAQPEKVEEPKPARVSTGKVYDLVMAEVRACKDKVIHNATESLSDLYFNYDFGCEDKVSVFGVNTLAMPNNKVYVNSKKIPWNQAQEVQLKTGEVVEIDPGCKIFLPKGYGIRLSYNDKLLSKFGLSVLTNRTVYSNYDAAAGINVRLCAKSEMSYVARFQPVVYFEVIKVNEAV